MDAFLQTTFSSAFSSMKMFEFWLRFHWSLFLSVKLTIFQHWFRWWLGAKQVTSHYVNQWWLVYWRIYASLCLNELTHWGRVTHICVGNLTIIGPDNSLSPGRRQPIIWTNAGILLSGPWGTNFSEILIGIQTFALKKNAFENGVCEMASILSRPQCVNWFWSWSAPWVSWNLVNIHSAKVHQSFFFFFFFAGCAKTIQAGDPCQHWRCPCNGSEANHVPASGGSTLHLPRAPREFLIPRGCQRACSQHPGWLQRSQYRWGSGLHKQNVEGWVQNSDVSNTTTVISPILNY